MSNIFNSENKGFESGKYPLFFGEDLGLFDTVNIAYPEIEKLYQLQMSQIWNEFEVDITQDKMDMMRLPKETADLMVDTISWQWLADSVAGFSIPSLILPHCTNSELEGMLMAQSMFEVIHARTYSHIVKQTFSDPQEAIKRTYANMDVIKRSDAIVKAFENMHSISMNPSSTRKEKVDALLKVLVALFALEGIAFLASFAVTFGIVETDVYQGIGALVALIARDEVLHTRMDWAILKILLKDPEWQQALKDCYADIKYILDSIVRQELSWAETLFTNRQLVGLNAVVLKEYVLHIAKPIYQFLGVDFDFEPIPELPLPYMRKYIDTSYMQSAPQEINMTSYKVGSIVDDTTDLDLDMDEF
tara:strand:- start:816 stop:1898 length:1083 start_codon:yes stop_codon:yes gene_type:complete